MAFPFGLKRRDIDDNAAARIGRFTQTDRQYRSWNSEVLNGSGQREGIRRYDTYIALHIDEAGFIKRLRIDNR